MEGLPSYERDIRPWGEYERFTLNEPSTVKIISVKPGEAFSLQTHEHRSEFWRVVSGAGNITVGSEVHAAKTGDHFMVKQGEVHRAEGGPEGLVFVEVAFGKFDEGDIKRLEDKYGRS